MGWLLLAILNNPAVQKKAHRELDEVIGRDRPPTLADMARMPYIKALIRETLRWHPADPLGVFSPTGKEEADYLQAFNTARPK